MFERRRGHAIDHLRVPVLAADGEGVVAPLREQLGVEDGVFRHQVPRAAGARHPVGDDAADGFRPAERQVGFQHAERQTPVVGQGVLVAVELQRVAIAAGGGVGAHLTLGIVVPLARDVHIQPQVVVGVRRQGQAAAQGPDLVLGRAAAKAGDGGLHAIDVCKFQG
ncbi:hypothetical protein D3C72_1457870 [compost metagenome]